VPLPIHGGRFGVSQSSAQRGLCPRPEESLWAVQGNLSLGAVLNRRGDGVGKVLPNLLPLPEESSPKQHEPRANEKECPTEIQGTG